MRGSFGSDESKGLGGDKAYFKRGYRLKLVNCYPIKIKVVVYDRMPIAGGLGIGG